MVLFAAIGSALEDPADDEATPAAADDSETVSSSPSPHQDPTTQPEPTPEPEPTSEPEPSPTPTEEVTLTEADIRTIVFPLVFDSSRDGILEVLRDMYIVESVDRYEYDSEGGTVHVSITPAYDFDSGVRDDAWTVTREFAVLYDEDNWLEGDSGWSPAIDIVISTAHYRCDGESLVAINDARFSRDDWESTCRVS